MTEHAYQIPGGCLRIRTTEEHMPLDDLLGFAARSNPRRPFLFVSKVLGRHVPCTPSRMRATYRMLALGMTDLPGPVWVIGMAETATGLGGGVADSLATLAARNDVHYQYTTRLALAAERLIDFQESHSHAPTHWLYEPLAHLRPAFTNTRTLVLVDDEISTGNSVAALAARVLAIMPCVERLVIASLVNWLDAPRRTELAAGLERAAGRDLDVSWPSLLSGTFSYLPQSDVPERQLPRNVEALRPGPLAREDLGRRGFALPRGGMRYQVPALDGVDPVQPVAVIGTGECAFEPFLVAEALEAIGRKVTVQCTSRSPVLPGGAIGSTLACPDPYDQGVGYYLHNPPQPGVFCVTVSEREDRGAPAFGEAASLHMSVLARRRRECA